MPVINHYKAFMFGMKALPSVGDLANEADVARPCLSMVFNVIPLIAPEYGEAPMKIDEPLGSVSIGFQSGTILYVANYQRSSQGDR